MYFLCSDPNLYIKMYAYSSETHACQIILFLMKIYRSILWNRRLWAINTPIIRSVNWVYLFLRRKALRTSSVYPGKVQFFSSVYPGKVQFGSYFSPTTCTTFICTSRGIYNTYTSTIIIWHIYGIYVKYKHSVIFIHVWFSWKKSESSQKVWESRASTSQLLKLKAIQ